jgi:hypothetical protein
VCRPGAFYLPLKAAGGPPNPASAGDTTREARRIRMIDRFDVALSENMRDLAVRGGGFTYYVWPNPTHSDAEELKLTYVLKVDEEWWLGAGIYLNGQAPIFSKEARKDLAAFVEGARNFALNNTKDAALKAFNDRNG